jgi:hypothetical protein
LYSKICVFLYYRLIFSWKILAIALVRFTQNTTISARDDGAAFPPYTKQTLGFQDKLFTSDRKASGPGLIALQGISAQRFTHPRSMMIGQRLQSAQAGSVNQSIKIKEPITPPLTLNFTVAAMNPLLRMTDDTSTDHVQIDVHQAAQ